MNVYVEVRESGDWRWCHEDDGRVTQYSSGTSSLPTLKLAEKILVAALIGADIGCVLRVDHPSILSLIIIQSFILPAQHQNLAQLIDEKHATKVYGNCLVGDILDRLAPS